MSDFIQLGHLLTWPPGSSTRSLTRFPDDLRNQSRQPLRHALIIRIVGNKFPRVSEQRVQPNDGHGRTWPLSPGPARCCPGSRESYGRPAANVSRRARVAATFGFGWVGLRTSAVLTPRRARVPRHAPFRGGALLSPGRMTRQARGIVSPDKTNDPVPCTWSSKPPDGGRWWQMSGISSKSRAATPLTPRRRRFQGEATRPRSNRSQSAKSVPKPCEKTLRKRENRTENYPENLYSVEKAYGIPYR